MAFEPDFVLYYVLRRSKSLQNPSNPPSFPTFCVQVFNACCGCNTYTCKCAIWTNVATLTDRGYLASERYYCTRNSCVRECENVHIVHRYKCVSGQDLGSDRVGLLRLNYLIVEGATHFDDIDIICPESIELH